VARDVGCAAAGALAPDVAGAVWAALAVGAELAGLAAGAALASVAAGAELAGGAAEAGGAADGGAELAGAELAGAVELPCDAAGGTALTRDDTPGATVWTADEVVEPTVPSRPVEPDVELLPEAGEPDGDDDGVVSAWAWRENRTRMARIPAASSTACIARRAM
jgi:hypothetical protein